VSMMGAGMRWLLVAIVAAAAAGFVVYDSLPQGKTQPVTSAFGLPLVRMSLGGKVWEIEVAATRPHIERGMGGRATFPEGTGMLFVFPDSEVRAFWMLDCLVDIDVAYMDRTGKVLNVATMRAESPQQKGESRETYMRRLTRYPSQGDAMYALELPKGSMKTLGIAAGMTLPVDHGKVRGMLR